MKSCYINKWFFVVMLVAMIGYNNDKPVAKHHAHADTSIIEVARDVNRSGVVSDIPVVTADSGRKIFTLRLNGVVAFDPRKQHAIAARVAGRIEKLYVKYYYQRIKKGQIIMELYSPQLVAAQRELLYLAQAGEEVLVEKAAEKLRLLGMSNVDVQLVLRTGIVQDRVRVYSQVDGYVMDVEGTENTADAQTPSSISLKEGQYVEAGQTVVNVVDANSVVAEFSVAAENISAVAKGRSLLIYPVNNKSNMQRVTVDLSEPVLRDGQQFNVVRAYLKSSDYKPGEILSAEIPIEQKGGSWLPAAAVLNTGSNKWVVYQKQQGRFVARDVVVQAVIDAWVLVSSNIAGWQVASNASYLADSESFISTNAVHEADH